MLPCGEAFVSPGGGSFLIERRGDEFSARRVWAVAIFPCEGVREAESGAALAAGFDKGDGREVTRRYHHGDLPEEQCWLRAPGWWLADR